MADTKLSLLTELATTPAATDELYISDAGVSKKIQYSNLVPAQTPEGTAILSTGEAGGTKFLREDGDNSCSWQAITEAVITDLGTTTAMVADNLSVFAATTSAQLAGVISDETGSGALVFATSPTLVTPALGTPASGNLSNCTGYPNPTECLVVACSDETTALTADTAVVTFRMPYAFTLSEVRASVTTAPTGSTIIVDINESGTTLMTTNKISIDATEKTSETAATAPTLTDTSLADDAEITIDIDQVGSTIAGAGLKVYLIGSRT